MGVTLVVIGICVVLYVWSRLYIMRKKNKCGWFMVTLALIVLPYLMCINCYEEFKATQSVFSQTMLVTSAAMGFVFLCIEHFIFPILMRETQQEDSEEE